MKFLFDIGHPAHVHYFKNLIWILQKKGHKIRITARDKEISLSLLNKYGFKYVCTSVNRSTLLGKGVSLIKNDYLIFKEAKKFNPDLLISFFLPFTSHVGRLLKKSVLGLDDTEHATLNRFLSERFTNTIVTPSWFTYKFPENKHIRFNGFFELAYLHPKYFEPEASILSDIGIKADEKYIFLRFVAWHASHDIGHRGLTTRMKRKFVTELSKYARVFISSEGELPEDLKQYQIKISPEKMHDVLAFATLYIGEGATMASECAVLGTPAIYVSSLPVGYLAQHEKYGLIYWFRNSEGVITKAVELLKDSNIRPKWQLRHQKMLSENIDVTAFLVWFVEKYPESVEVMKKNPGYQYRFKTIPQRDTLHFNN